MLPTVATHTPRNSRATDGGVVCAEAATARKEKMRRRRMMTRYRSRYRAVPFDMAKYDKTRAWKEARLLVSEHRSSLAIGLVLMVINRLAGLVLPWTSKFLIDDIVGKHRADLLMPLASAAAVATLIQAATSFSLAQVVSIAAQRAITEMRKRVQAHVLRLPISFFDSTKSGVLVSRIMTDAEGVRNLVGTGLIQLLGSVMT